MNKRTLFYGAGLIILAIGCSLLVTTVLGYHGFGRQLLLIGAFWLLAVAMFWIARRLPDEVLIVAGLLVLAALFLPASALLIIFSSDSSADPFGSIVLLSLFVLLSAALVLCALLFSRGLTLYERGQTADDAPAAGRWNSSKTAVVLLVLSVLLLAKALHSLYQFTLWDSTHDALGYICLGGPLLAALFAGALLLVTLPGKEKLAVFFYLPLIPLLLVAISTLGQRVDIRQLTEERAARVDRALNAYYEENGRYPQSLRQLRPRYLLSLSEPAIIFGQDWCFESSGDAYTLGYVTRDHWSDPRLYGRVYRSTGAEPLEGIIICEQEIVALNDRAPDYYNRRGD